MILETGGAGFVGSNPIAGLEERGHRGIVSVVGTAAGRTIEVPGRAAALGDRARFAHSMEARIDRLRAAGFDTPFLPVEEGIGRYVRGFAARGDPCP